MLAGNKTAKHVGAAAQLNKDLADQRGLVDQLQAAAKADAALIRELQASQNEALQQLEQTLTARELQSSVRSAKGVQARAADAVAAVEPPAEPATLVDLQQRVQQLNQDLNESNTLACNLEAQARKLRADAHALDLKYKYNKQAKDKAQQQLQAQQQERRVRVDT